MAYSKKIDIPPKYKIIKRKIAVKIIKEIFIHDFFISIPPLLKILTSI